MPDEFPDLVQTVRLAQVIAGLPAFHVFGDAHTPITGIEFDSRKIQPGDLFVALPGGYVDGHSYADQARARGASALLVERQLPVDLPQVVVTNTRSSLAIAAATFYRNPANEINVIGVTGTDGKTTTCYLIEAILSEAGLRCGVIGTIGVRIGDRFLETDTRQTTPESLDVQRYLRTMIADGASHAIIEATSHGLELHRLDEIRFGTAAVTNVTHEHLEHHKTLAAYRRAKGILFERVAETGGLAVINLDDEGAREMRRYSGAARVITYSAEGREAGVRAVAVELGAGHSRFIVQHDAENLRFETALVGEFNVANALCAISVALANDISLKICQKAFSQIRQIPGRMESIQQGQPFSVIVDYAHTPESTEKVLKLVRGLTRGRLMLVMGSAGERDREKRPLQGAVAAKLADYSVFTTEDPRFEDAGTIISEIAAGARAAGAVEGIDFRCIVDRRQAIEHILADAGPGDCVVLAGKGHERSIIWGNEKRSWNEAQVASEVLVSLGHGGVEE